MVRESGGREALLEGKLGPLVNAKRELVERASARVDALGHAGLEVGGHHRCGEVSAKPGLDAPTG